MIARSRSVIAQFRNFLENLGGVNASSAYTHQCLVDHAPDLSINLVHAMEPEIGMGSTAKIERSSKAVSKLICGPSETKY